MFKDWGSYIRETTYDRDTILDLTAQLDWSNPAALPAASRASAINARDK